MVGLDGQSATHLLRMYCAGLGRWREVQAVNDRLGDDGCESLIGSLCTHPLWDWLWRQHVLDIGVMLIQDSSKSLGTLRHWDISNRRRSNNLG